MNGPIPKIPRAVPARTRLRMVFRPALIPLTVLLRRRMIRSYLTRERDPKLHVGCGAHLLAGWLNADRSLLNRRGMIYLDARKRLPFASSSFAFIFNEHFISYLTLEEGVNLFREFRRILRSGGVVRTAAPDLAVLVDVYLHGEPPYSDYVRWASKAFLDGAKHSRAMVINNFFYGHGQKFIYDRATLAWALRQAGFCKIIETKIGESEHPELRGIEGHGQSIPQQFNELETMVLEAAKD